MIGRQRCVTLIFGPFGKRLVLIQLVPFVRLVQVGLGVCFALVALLSDLADFIPESGHFFHLDVALGSFA